MEKLTKNLIAPCGINCGRCRAYLREKNKCPGCNNDPIIPSCQKCKIRLCEKRQGKYCFECEEFPCVKIKHLDKRYRERYDMSEIENLNFIKCEGIDKFVKAEREKWQTLKGVLCIHDQKYY